MSKQDKSYQSVIDIISVEQDWKAIVLEIAKKHPRSVVEAASETKTTDNLQTQQESSIDFILDALLRAGKKIVAIKTHRVLTHSSLKEAKLYCEKREAIIKGSKAFM